MKRNLLLYFLTAFCSTTLLWSAVTSQETISGNRSNTMTVDAGLLVGPPASAAGVDVGIAQRISSSAPLYIGGNLAVFAATGTPSYAIIPILGEMHYQFGSFEAIHPILGVMAGPVISTGPSSSNIEFGLIFRPGVNINLGRTAMLNVEPRFGVIGSDFVAMPVIGAQFPL